jgi:hypothetical protein
VLCRHVDRGGRRPAQVDVGLDLVRRDLGALDREVPAGVVDALALPEPVEDLQELARPRVALLLVGEVAEAPLLVVVAAGGRR